MRRSWRRRAMWLGAIWAVLAVVTLSLGMRPDLAVVAGLVVAIGMTLFLISDLQLSATSSDWHGSYTHLPRRLGADYRVNALRRQIEESTARRGRASSLCPTLYAIAAQRLRSSNGIDLETQPQRAAEMLGESAVRYLRNNDPSARTDPAFLSDLLSRIENL